MKQSTTTSISYSQKTVNGKTVYIFNDMTYETMGEMMNDIQKKYPNISFQTSTTKNKNQENIKQSLQSNKSNQSSGFEISKYKGTNAFSNKIFDNIWVGYDYTSDSCNNFSDMKRRFLQESNEYRKAHKVSPLTEDSDLAIKAQVYAKHLADINTLRHDPKNQQEKTGENLGFASTAIGQLVVKQWYDEIENYDFYKSDFKSGTGHFTQLVWKETSKVGFGVAEKNGNIFVVCKYFPQGNCIGHFKENVFNRQT